MVWEYTIKKRREKKLSTFSIPLTKNQMCVSTLSQSTLPSISSHIIHSSLSDAFLFSRCVFQGLETTHMRLQSKIKRINGTLYHQMRDYNDDSCWERRIESERILWFFTCCQDQQHVAVSPRALIAKENSNYYSSHNKYLWKVTSSWMRLADRDDGRLDLTWRRLV